MFEIIPLLSIIDYIWMFFITWAILIVTPPYFIEPWGEIPFIIVGKFLGLKIWMGELIAQAFAVSIILLSTMIYGPTIWMKISSDFMLFISNPVNLIITIVFAIGFAVAVWYFDFMDGWK